MDLDSVGSTEALRNLLAEDEWRRADRFVNESDRRRFVAAHGLARIILGRCVDRPPQSLHFAVASRGKPRLEDQAVPLRFNLSHAGGRALLAISRDREVGVDIERVRAIEVLELATRFFASGERAALCSLPSDQQQAAFFRCWTRKESFIKALGDGLSFPLDGFEVSLAAESAHEGQEPILRACDAAPDELGRWTIAPLVMDPGYAAALTAGGHGWRLVRWNQPVLTGSQPVC
jgi:4'-phosphopantetheinyl transferase